MEFIRLLLGGLGFYFAHFFGRALVRTFRSQSTKSRGVTWALRTIIAVGAVVRAGGLDIISIAVLALCSLSFAAGVYDEVRPRKPKIDEDLTKIMFQKDEDDSSDHTKRTL